MPPPRQLYILVCIAATTHADTGGGADRASSVAVGGDSTIAKAPEELLETSASADGSSCPKGQDGPKKGKCCPAGEYHSKTWGKGSTCCKRGGLDSSAYAGGKAGRAVPGEFFESRAKKCVLCASWGSAACTECALSLEGASSSASDCTACATHYGMQVKSASLNPDADGWKRRGMCYDTRGQLTDVGFCLKKGEGLGALTRVAKLTDTATICSKLFEITSAPIVNLREFKKCGHGAYNATGGSCMFDADAYKRRFNDPSAGVQTTHAEQYKSQHTSVAQCGFSKIADCTVVNTTTGKTHCQVSKTVTCNAIRPYSPHFRPALAAGLGPAPLPVLSEIEACKYAPHACTFIAEVN